MDIDTSRCFQHDGEEEGPFALIQTDVKDIHDKEALGTALTTHLTRHHLPHYQ